MATCRLDDAELRATLQRIKERGSSIHRELVPTMKFRLMQVAGEAANLAPIAEGTLRRSRQASADVVGQQVQGRIRFGGLAAAYASRQHEDETLAHTPEEYERKFGRQFGKHQRSGKISRTRYQRVTLRGVTTARGKINITTKRWTYKRKSARKGYRGGQAHFLYGAANSPWNESEQRLMQDELLEVAVQEFQALLMEGAGD